MTTPLKNNLSPSKIWGDLMPYIHLMRLHRPIGIWLCLFPGLWGLGLASKNINLLYILLFIFGAIFVRGAGCTLNDLMDREIDKKNSRTQNRPLASGQLSPRHAFVFFVLQLLVAFGILLCFNKTTLLLGIFILIPLMIYPLLKRVTYWPQIFLGFLMNWGILMGWTALLPTFSWEPFLFYFFSIFWTIGYDTAYAFQDYKEDVRLGVKSLPLKIGFQKARLFLMGCYGVFFLGILGLAFLNQKPFLGGLILPLSLYTLVKIKRLRLPHEGESFFQYNKIIGLVIWAGVLLPNLIGCFHGP